MNVEKLNESYDWSEAFRFAESVRDAHNCANSGFGIDDVSTIIAESEGENDGESWLMVGTLKDGRYFFLSAWCDYTGWDCQAGGDAHVADTLPELIRLGLGDSDRERLNLKLEQA